MGCLVTGFDEDPMFPFPWTPPYYRGYFESLNYQPTYPLWYYEVDFTNEKYREAKQRFANHDAAVIRAVSKKKWDKDIDTVTDMLHLTVLLPATVNNFLTRKSPVPESLGTIPKQRDGYHKKWDIPQDSTMRLFFKEYPEYVFHTNGQMVVSTGSGIRPCSI